jgi:hypothetical protein
VADDLARRLLASGLLSVSAVAHAACEPQGALVFSCATSRGNHVELCAEGSAVRYSFGEPGRAPQVAVTMPRDEVRLVPWRALGKVESYALMIPFRESTHVVYWTLDDPGDQPEAGVQVLVDGEPRATMQCVPAQVLNNIPKGGFRGPGG